MDFGVNQEIYTQIRVCFIGAENIGKTTFIRRIAGHDIDTEYFPTIGADIQHVYLHNCKIRLQLWDLAGSERFSRVIDPYIYGCDIVCFCFDCCNYESLNILNRRFKFIKSSLTDQKTCFISMKNDKTAPDKEIINGYGEEMAKSEGSPFFVIGLNEEKEKGENDFVEWICKSDKDVTIVDGNIGMQKDLYKYPCDPCGCSCVIL